MLLAAIFHQARGVYAYPVASDQLMVQLKAAKGDLKRVYLVYGDRYSGLDSSKQTMMENYASDQFFDYFRVEIQLSTKRFAYYFLLDDGQQQIWYHASGFSQIQPSDVNSNCFQYPYITEGDLFQIPDWVKEAVIYQIFPERFFNGDLTNDPVQLKGWGESPEGEACFFGGDLAGIIHKLSHLERLGVNLLYLNPIFSASTNHKYDTRDYYQIDPHFGDQEIFRQLVEEAHQRGIRVVLDIVLNHCGYQFFQFQDVVLRGRESEYYDWFYINQLPVSKEEVNYETFANNVWRMPKLRTANPEVKQYLLNVAEYWVKEFDIDGWRLDVANEIDHVFWREFRQRLKALKPDIYIVGEIWHHAGDYLRGDQFDGVMNYLFRDVILRFFADRQLSVSEFDASLTENRVTYQKQGLIASWNILDSHDTERIITRFQHNRPALKLAILFQMTYLGVPMIYYGTEVGLAGGDDPDCRRCMEWDEKNWDHDLFAYYQKLIQIRKKITVLRDGEFKTVFLSEFGVYGFLRYDETSRVLIVLNNGVHQQEVLLDVVSWKFSPNLIFHDLITETKYQIVKDKLLLHLKPLQGVILVQD